MAEGDRTIRKFISDQLSKWPLACDNFRALKNVETKDFEVGGLKVTAQFNPARIISSAARTDAVSIGARPCFLCRGNRPEQQMHLNFEGRKGKKYDILVNPYPIFPDHLVIAMEKHCDQTIANRYVDILDLARTFQSFTFFYNGPKCGASAPDHHHFQGTARLRTPLEQDIDRLINDIPRDASGNYVDLPDQDDREWKKTLVYLASIQDAHLYSYKRFAHGIYVIRARTVKSAAKLFYRLLDCAEIPAGDVEPRINLFTWFEAGEFRSIIIFRRQHRSHHYFSDGPDHLVMSPGCVDMGGLFIVPRSDDFEKMSSSLLSGMVEEVTLSAEEEKQITIRLTRSQPRISVGIMSGVEIEFELISDGAGRQKASYREGKIDYGGVLYDELHFDAQTPSTMFAEPSFILYGVTIGAGFHWERREDQKFAGALKIIVDGHKLTAVNVIGVEDYLLSVISSEMRSTSSEEFLRAHAVISRSWVMSQILKRERRPRATFPEGSGTPTGVITWVDILHSRESEDFREDETIRWYDHEDHKLFDVCADDHCQRYQGLTRAVGETVRKAVDYTWGEVLCYDGEICDARFSKCCGGTMEKFPTCWEDKDYPYLQALPDTPDHNPAADPYCSTSDKSILTQVLNGYDLETPDFFSWTQEYDIDDLSGLIERRSGRHIGRLTALTPVERGASGRISRLRIAGTEGAFTTGKELEIRRVLSESHLKSSAFDVEFLPGRVILHGRGWGHGVGLCQIGAAVMASKGFVYRQILAHYYPGAQVENMFK